MPREGKKKKPLNVRRALDLGFTAGPRSALVEVPRASEGCPSYGQLPRDVLMVIFSYFARRPILATISFVCKRWRAAALESVHSLDEYDEVTPDFLPSITSWVVTRPMQHVPTTLRNLIILHKPGEKCLHAPLGTSAEAASKLRLERLELTLTLDCSYCFLPIGQQGLTSLTSLTLSVTVSGLRNDVYPIIFPALASLSLIGLNPHDSDTYGGVNSMLLDHASQLTSLSVEHPTLFQLGDQFFCLPFSRLRRLHLQYTPTANGNALVAFAQANPQTHTSLSLAEYHATVTDALAPLVEGVCYTSTWNETHWRLSNCTRLKKIQIRGVSRNLKLEQILLSVTSTLESLEVGIELADVLGLKFYVLSKCLRLTHLTVTADRTCISHLVVLQYRLPALTHLCLYVSGHHLEAALRLYKAFIKCAPKLRSLSANLPRTTTRKHVEVVANFLFAVEKDGLEFLCLRCERNSALTVKHLVSQLRWLRLVLDYPAEEPSTDSDLELCSEESSSDE